MNPYQVLNLRRGSTGRDAVQAVAAALKERKYSSREIALAQRALLDPVSRGVQEFLNFIELERPRKEPGPEVRPECRLRYLPSFENV